MMKLASPTKEQFDLIYGEFDTSRERIRGDVQVLISWLAKQAHLPNVTDEEFLEHILLRCKNRLEVAKIVLERYFSLKTVLPEVYDNRDPYNQGIVEAMKVVSFIPMPELTADGCRVSICRILNPDKYLTVPQTNIVKSVVMSGDLRAQIDSCHSDIFIFDIENFSMPIVTRALASLRKFVLPGLKGIQMRHKQNYVINAKPATESLLLFSKSLLPKSLVGKIKVLKSQDELLDFIPKNCLPKNYGGEQPLFEDLTDAWIRTLQHHADWFNNQDGMKADNSKRLNREESSLGDIPLEGSFRQISFD